MTYNEIIDALRYQAAKMLLDNMDDEKVVKMISELMDQGVYFDDFLGVLDKPDYRPDFLKAVKSSLFQLGVLIPKTEDQATWSLMRHHISKMVDRSSNALNSLDALMADVYLDSSLSPKSLKDQYGAKHLIRLYWEYDELCLYYCPNLPPRSELDECENKVRDYAQQWLNIHG